MSILRHCVLPILLLALLLSGPPSPAVAEVSESAAPATPGSAEPPAATVDQAVARALAWVQHHRATPQEGGFLEMGEEVYMLYVLHNTAGDKAARDAYVRQIASRQTAMQPHVEADMESRSYLFDPWGPTNYAVLAAMFQRVGLPIADYRRIIQDMQLFHWKFFPDHPSVRMVLGLYLQRLGLESPVPVQQLIEHSRLYREPSTHAVQKRLSDGSHGQADAAQTEGALYDLTHEILGLTDFGALPAPAFVCRQAAEYRRVLDAGMDWAMAHGTLDVLAELAVCTKLVGLGDHLPSLDRAIATVVSHQQQDGSFGAAMPTRENKYRHAVLTGASALAVSRCDNVCGSVCSR
jgi:hypothetical protein